MQGMCSSPYPLQDCQPDAVVCRVGDAGWRQPFQSPFSKVVDIVLEIWHIVRYPNLQRVLFGRARRDEV